ncbi:hypothetical protein RND71_026640 [Anisodus tanguticus]|uniref:RING-type E3 ubiquitin transferase n=1 Tax=Anisodus tanguticus TaxID=243964 RepID=A0AAE1V8H6_9SOLA|nr:hypothetical protein RND71_026640 [Anisodus tanguticus]
MSEDAQRTRNYEESGDAKGKKAGSTRAWIQERKVMKEQAKTRQQCDNASSSTGPFVCDWETEDKTTMYKKFNLLITDLHCLPETNFPKTARIFAICRALFPSEDRLYSGTRTGLSRMTISTEETWSSSTGAFSITQRNILTGTISSIKETYVPLRFKKELRPLDIWKMYHKYSKSYLSYRTTNSYREYFSHVAKIFLEGVYNASKGVMHIGGCSEIRSQNESNLDCVIEVKVQYSSKTTRWLINPTARLSIASLQNLEDPFYFSPINLKTFLIPYRDKSKEIKFRLNFEATFRIFVLLISAACLLSQLYYVERNMDATPLISVVMLSIQLLGYGIPLVMDTPILFAWKEYLCPQNRSLHTATNIRFKFVLKLLLFIIFVLTLRLFQKVWDSRRISHRPNDKKVLMFASTIHVFKTKPLSKVYYVGLTVLRFSLCGYDYLRNPVFSVYFHTDDSALFPLCGREAYGSVYMISVKAVVIGLKWKDHVMVL